MHAVLWEKKKIGSAQFKALKPVQKKVFKGKLTGAVYQKKTKESQGR